MHHAPFHVALWLVFLPSIPVAAQAPAGNRVDVVIGNARVWTGDPQRPEAQTVLVRGRHIVRVCGPQIPRDLATDGAVMIDAGGRRVIPGLIDCHAHVLSGGLNLSQLQLREAADRDDFILRVRRHAARLGSDDWVLGRGWTVESWRAPDEPHQDWLEDATGGRPAFLKRMDGHQALVNAKALAMAGITRDTTDPLGGHIGKDPRTGEPTGILKDAAMNLVARLIPSPGYTEMQAALRRARDLYLQYGVTMVHTMADFEGHRVLSEAQSWTDWRLYPFLQQDDWIAELRLREVRRDPWPVKWAGFKGYMDGSLGSRTAFMRAPFADNPPDEAGQRGLLVAFAAREAPKDLRSQFRAAARIRAQPAVHAIGDQANHLLLNAYEALLSEFPDIRPRVEHAQHLLPGDVARFGRLGVIPSMQPYHKADDGRYAEKRLGYERCKTSYAFRSLLDTGAVVCFGSDWPVMSNNPFLGIHAAVTGKTLDNRVFVPEQNISVAEALACYTANAAYACFMEDRLGRIKEGYLADLVILNQDVLNVAPDAIAKVTVHTTIVGGRVVFERSAGRSAPNTD